MAYANDLVLLAKNKELNDMADKLRSFLSNRKPILREEKTKVMVFNRAKNCRKEKWFWEGKEFEEVTCFKYLGFTFNKDGN